MDLSKLTLEIFSKLEQKWLSDPFYSPPSKPQPKPKTRILTIDGGLERDGIVAAEALVHLETQIKVQTGNPSARITDHFHLLAGTGLGGVLALLLTVSNSDNNATAPLFSASEARDFLLSNLPNLFRRDDAGRFFLPLRRRRRRLSGKSFSRTLRGVFKNMTLRDTCKPVLVPCYDLNSSAPFVFSRADASGSPSFDFELVDVCRATSASPGVFKPCGLVSVDKKTQCVGLSGGLVMNNPAAAAVTHVMHNKRDFPGVGGVEDLAVLSIGNGRVGVNGGEDKSDGGDLAGCSNLAMEIVFRGVSDTVDQILTNAFCWNPTNYLRIQTNGLTTEEGETKAIGERRGETAEELKKAGERMLLEIGVESLPFGGKRLLKETNGERIEAFVRGLVVPSNVVEPLLLLPPPSPSWEEENANGVTLLADGR